MASYPDASQVLTNRYGSPKKTLESPLVALLAQAAPPAAMPMGGSPIPESDQIVRQRAQGGGMSDAERQAAFAAKPIVARSMSADEFEQGGGIGVEYDAPEPKPERFGLKGEYAGLQSFSQDRSKGDTPGAVRRILEGGYQPMLDTSIEDARRASGRTPTRSESANEDAYVGAQVDKFAGDEEELVSALNVPAFDPQVYQLQKQAELASAQDRLNRLEFAKRFYQETGLPATPESMKMMEAARKSEAVSNDLAQFQSEFDGAKAEAAQLMQQTQDPAVIQKINAALAEREKEYQRKVQNLMARIAAESGRLSVTQKLEDTNQQGSLIGQ